MERERPESSLALRGAVGFGVGGALVVVWGKTVGFVPGFPLSEYIGFPVAGIIGGAVLASAARNLSPVLLAAFGFALGFGLSGGLALGVMFALGLGKASALQVGAVWAVAWAIGGGIAGPFLGPTIVPLGATLRTLAALALAGGLAFGCSGFIGGFVSWTSPRLLGVTGVWLGFALTMFAGGTLTGGALGWLARAHSRDVHEPERSAGAPPGRRSGLATLAAILAALGLIVAVVFLARFRLPFGPAETSHGAALLLAALGVPPLLLGLRALAEIRKSRGGLRGGRPAAAGIAVGAFLTLLAGLLLVGPLARRLEADYHSTRLQEARGPADSGQAIHDANIALGRIALKAGKIEEAKRYLLEAGKTPGSPALNTFGPDLTLATELLARGEREAVITYLELCASFWDSGQGRLGYWISELKKGGTPNFKASVVEMAPTPSSASSDPPRQMMAPSYESDTERMGSERDYIGESTYSESESHLEPVLPVLCQADCKRNPQCRAWTYIKPNTIKGPRPRCRLERELLPPRPNTCCVSGVRPSEPTAEARETASFRITNIKLLPATGVTGRCPFEGDVRAYVYFEGGSSQIAYRFLYSDGYVSRIRTKTFSPPAIGSPGTSRIYGDSFVGWVVLQILEPYRLESDPVVISIKCR